MSSNKTKPSSFGFSSAFMHYQRRNRWDSGKLDSKDSRESSHYEKEILKNKVRKYTKYLEYCYQIKKEEL